MNTTSVRSVAMIFVLGAMAPAAAMASTTLAKSSGAWATRQVDAVLLSPDGAKASADLGSARCAVLGHLDSDGVVDLVVAYGSSEGSFAVVTPGDLRFRLGPHHDLERERLGLEPERPFIDEAVVFPLPFAPDWIAVGDWDSDGDFDVVFAARGERWLYWMAGDGQAHLTPGVFIELEGGVTAFASGEVNRRDGLDDLVLAIDGRSGPALLVFEGPEGALSRGPERIGMAAAVTSLAIDWLDGDPWRDIAAASGEAVVIVSGRDRRLVSTRAKREAVLPAAITPLGFDEKVLDLAAGFFTHRDRQAQLAVRLESGEVRLVRNLNRRFEISDLGRMPVEGRMLAARASGLRGHDLLIDSHADCPIEIFHAGASKATGARLERMAAPEAVSASIVTGRLNLDTRDDLVLLGEDGTIEVAVSKNRIAIVVDTTDDIDDGGCGTTAECSLREAIISANIQPAGSTITFDLPLGSTVTPASELPALTQTAATIIDGTIGSGILTGVITVQGASAGTASGLVLSGGNATITTMNIQGFADGSGIEIDNSHYNTVQGCRLGLDSNGIDSDANGIGIKVMGSYNTIGGSVQGEGNVVSGNSLIGVFLYMGGDNLLLGNVIGTDPGGNTALPNGGRGIYGSSQARLQIGNALSGGGNLISGNAQEGVSLGEAGAGGEVLMIGNTIGLDSAQSSAIPNGGSVDRYSGVFISQTANVTIGGSNAVTRNVISANPDDGIEIRSNCPDAVISGNFIGTDGAGTTAFPNGTASSAAAGISMYEGETMTIGGTATGTGNLIAGNHGSGILANSSSPSDSIEILGNHIGLGLDGSALGNTGDGVCFLNGMDLTIGGTGIGASNTIAANDSVGIRIGGLSSGVAIGPNSIYDNGGLGIDLGGDGVTANDALDADTGANNLQNFPEIEFVEQSTGDVDFLLDSESSKTYTVRFYESPSCDASGYGEGKTYLGSMNVTTESDGNASDQITLGPLTPGGVITATATDQSWNTSEFSLCFSVPYPDGYIFFDNFESGDTSAWTTD